jgi:hypothetical protein
MKIYLATWMLEKSQGQTLTKLGKRERLLSYFHIISDQFKKYIKTGE